MKAVYGLYADGHSAQQAFNRLKAAGVAPSDITVLTAQPMEEFEFGNLDKATYIWWFACLGGLIGMSLAFGLAYLTETAWEMNVGGLPIFAWWPNLIIIFELTMLGAITATTLTARHHRADRGQGQALRPGSDRRADPDRRREPARQLSRRPRAQSLAAPPGARVKRAP